MASARAIFQAHVDGLFPESIPIDLQWSVPTALPVVRTFDLNSGDNLIVPASGVTLVIYVPPPANGTALKLKGAPGDTGLVIQTNKPVVLTWTATSTLYINAAAGVAGGQIIFL